MTSYLCKLIYSSTVSLNLIAKAKMSIKQTIVAKLLVKKIHLLVQSHKNKKFWEDLIAYFPLIRYGPHIKRLQQFSYCCVSIRCSGNVFTEPLPSKERGIHILTHSPTGGIYEVRHSGGLSCHDAHTTFRKDWFWNLKINADHSGRGV
jgi:hypothetical protein